MAECAPLGRANLQDAAARPWRVARTGPICCTSPIGAAAWTGGQVLGSGDALRRICLAARVGAEPGLQQGGAGQER